MSNPAKDDATPAGRARRKIIRARAALTLTQPFWGFLARNLKPVACEDIETMATDGESLFFSPEYVLKRSDPELRGILVHEVEHVARLHHTRRGRREHELFNRAADYAINPGLLKAGFKLPEGCLNDPKFAGMSSEAIYAKLKKEQDKQALAGQGSPLAGMGQGAGQSPAPPSQGQQANASANGKGRSPTSGGNSEQQDADPTETSGNQRSPTPADPAAPKGGQNVSSSPGKPTEPTGNASAPKPAKSPGGFGQIMDAPGGPAGRAKAEAKAQMDVRQAAMVAKAQGAGTLPGFIEEIIRELDRPVVDWRAALRRFADESTIRETSWTRPARRPNAGGFILPGKESVAPAHVVDIIDTSGSMDRRALAACGGELQGMLDDGAVERITVVYADTMVQRVEEYSAGDLITLNATGRGGTAFAPALAWVTENCPDASAIVYLTDLDNSERNALTDPGIPVLWIYTDPGRGRAMPFGEVLHLDPGAEG